MSSPLQRSGLCSGTVQGGLSGVCLHLAALGQGSKKFVNSAAGFMKHRAADLQMRRPRDDGLTPQQLTKRFRFKARAMLQAAILRGNGLLAASVGV